MRLTPRPRTSNPGKIGAVVLAATMFGLGACGDEDAPVAAADPSADLCAAATDFGARVVDVGIAYDYQPAASPAEVADQSGVAFRGRLTGGVETIDNDDRDGAGQSYVTYGVVVDAVAERFAPAPEGTAVTVAVGDVATVRVAYNGQRDAAFYQEAAATGIDVIVAGYAAPESSAPAGNDAPVVVAGIEGFAAGCADQAPTGWVGGLGGAEGSDTPWGKVVTMDDLWSAMAGEAVTASLWHCGVDPIDFDGGRWRFTEGISPDVDPIDETTVSIGFAGTGQMRHTAEGTGAVYIDDGAYEGTDQPVTLRFEPLVGELEAVPCA